MTDFPMLHHIYFQFSKLPYLIQIENVAIIHAEVPLFINSFSDLVEKIEEQHIDTLESLLWGRLRVEMDINKKVDGIGKIYCGHTPLPEADNYGNHRVVDIGSYKTKSGKLHIEKINFDEDKQVSTRIKTDKVEPRFDEDSGYTYIRILDLPEEDQKLFRLFLYGASMPSVKTEERWGAAWVHDYKIYLAKKRSYIQKYNGLEEFKKALQ